MSSKKITIKSRSGGNNVTLFPFLAVLLCTMGGLIMLLIVITRNIREQNDVSAVSTVNPAAQETVISEAETQYILEQIQQEADEAEWYAENFAQSGANAEKELADIRAELASKERQTEKIKDELDRLAKLAKTLQNNEKINQDTEYLTQSLAQRQQQKKDLESVLSQLQKEAAQDAKSYAIIPYKGKNGTFRRPVYVECKDNKVIIQPEGVELNLDDFILADRPDNPMDTALRVVRQYYTETNQVQRGTEPYPLLVVRPSGVEAYSMVRQALGSWVNEYGYELVDEDWQMKYPPSSEELRLRLEKQLESSRIRMAAYLAAMKAERFGNAMAARQFRVDGKGAVEPVEGTNYGAGGVSPLMRQPNVRNNNVPSAPPSEDKFVGKVPDNFTAGNHTGSTAPTGTEAAGYAKSSIPYQFPDVETADSGRQIADGGRQTADGRKQTAENGAELQKQPDNNQNSNVPASNFSVQPVPAGGMPAVAMSVTTTPEMQPQMPSDMPKPSGNPLFNKHQKHNENNERADNWALRGAEQSATAMKRNVKIRCEKDKFVLTEQQGLIGIRVVPITDSVWSATDKLVIQIWDFMETWETAGERYFWLPVLQAEVAPGGEQRFEQLCNLLNNSGFSIERKGNNSPQR
jgi:hypothetical protein